MPRLPLLALAAALLLPAAHAQYALRVDVVAAAAADAAGGSYRLQATVGQPTVGSVAGGAYVLGQGFWYPATLDGPPSGLLVDLTLTPIDPPPPVVIARGATLRYRAEFAIAQNGPASFQYWAEATLPNNQIRFLFGPVAVTGTPGTTVTRNLQQRVPNVAPPGSYVFRMKVGQYPGTVYDEDSFPVTVTASEALAARDVERRRAAGAADEGGASRRDSARGAAAERVGAAEVAETVALPEAVARRIAAAPDAWLAWDEDGTILEALREAEDDARGETAVAETQLAPGTPAHPTHAAEVPAAVALLAPFPNPSGARATLRFGLAAAGVAQLTVADALGRRVAVLLDGTCEAGWHEAVLDGRDLPAGLYLVRLEAGGAVATARLTRAR